MSDSQDIAVERTRFGKDLAAPEPIPEAGVQAAVALMRDGRLFRYGEDRSSLPETALLEEEFAAWIGLPFCLGLNSGGCTLFVALKAAGVEPGDRVLTNAFTLAPVPGAIAHAGADAVLVDIDERFVIDVEDLDRKAAASGARYLLLSYMRGHIPDMDAVTAVCARHQITLIEDCAHTMGAHWAGQPTGTFGRAGCFSTQTFKHMNSGEGGLLVTADEDLAARAVLLSGSYMLYAQHRARPDQAVFERHRYDMPNCSMRMSSLVASILRPQLALMEQRAQRWRSIHDRLAGLLRAVPGVVIPQRPQQEGYVPSSLQFTVPALDRERMQHFVSESIAHGVHLKWFGGEAPVGFTSRHDHWRYLERSRDVPNADRILDRLCDLRLPLWLEDGDCRSIAAVIREAMHHVDG